MTVTMTIHYPVSGKGLAPLKSASTKRQMDRPGDTAKKGQSPGPRDPCNVTWGPALGSTGYSSSAE